MPEGGLESLKLELSRGKDVGQGGKVLVFDRARVHAPQGWLTCLLEKGGLGWRPRRLISSPVSSSRGGEQQQGIRFPVFLVFLSLHIFSGLRTTKPAPRLPGYISEACCVSVSSNSV